MEEGDDDTAIEYFNVKPEKKFANNLKKAYLSKSSDERVANEKTAQAIESHIRGKSDRERLKYAELALEFNPESEKSMFTAAYIMSKDPKTKAASIEIYRALIEINPEYPYALNNLAYELMEQGQFQDAIHLFKQAISSTPDKTLVLTNLGYALLKNGQYDEAIEVYKRMLDDEPDNLNALFKSGFCYEKLGKNKTAIQYYKTVLKRDPYYKLANNNIGYSYAKLGEYSTAIKYYRQELEYYPESKLAENNLKEALDLIQRDVL